MYIVKNRYNDGLFNGSYAECRAFKKDNSNELLFIIRGGDNGRLYIRA